MGRKIAIMGTAGTLACPPSPNEFEWWGVGPAVFHKADSIAIEKAKESGTEPILPSRNLKRWYELHTIHDEHYLDNETGETFTRAGVKTNEASYWEWMKTLKCHVFMQFKEKDIPCSVRFPVEDMISAFGPYFGGSACWMLGHAIYEHVMGDNVDLITMPGIHLSTTEEYAKERGLMNFMMGRAAGLGIKIECYDILLPPMIYGYTKPGEDQMKLPEKYMRNAA